MFAINPKENLDRYILGLDRKYLASEVYTG